MSIYCWSTVAAAALCFAVCYAGDILVVEKPDYVELEKVDGSLKLSQLQHVISGWFGFTLHKEIEYQGIVSSHPFSHPRATVILSLFNGKQVLEGLNGTRIRTVDDEDFVPTHNLEHHLKEFYDADSHIYKLDIDTKAQDLDGRLDGLNDDEDFALSLLAERFNFKMDSDQDMEVEHFLRQLSLAVQALDRVKDYDAGAADLFSFEMVVPVDVKHKVKSMVEKLLGDFITQVKEVMRDIYGRGSGEEGDYILLALSWDNKHSVSSRKSRSLLQADEPAKENLTPQNLATEYSEDYAVMFHIILWLSVILIVLVIYVLHGMMGMDPGSDSIIYRMTTTRLKKD